VWSLASGGGGGSPAASGRPAGPDAHGEPLPLETLSSIRDAARRLMNEGRLARAEALLAAAVAKHPAEQDLRSLHAQALLGLERLEESLQQFQKACFIGPDDPALRDFAATVAAELGQNEVAERHYAVAQKLDPGNPKYPLYRAQVQRRLGMNDEARMNLTLATRLDPELADAWATLAAIALDENRPSMTLEYVRRARALEPENLAYRLIECKGLRRQSRPEEAANLLYALPEAVRLSNRAVVEELAMCLGLMGETDRIADLYASASDASRGDAGLARKAAEWARKAGRPQAAPLYERRADAGTRDAP
jgi:tetratricopeptide (TPR) repeat protein